MTAVAATLRENATQIPDSDPPPSVAAGWFDHPQAQSEFANCLLPLVDALGWRGDARELAEALPHFIDDLDLQGLRNALANLDYVSHIVRVRQHRVDPSLMPCLFVPDRGPVRVLLGRENGKLLVFDGWQNKTRRTAAWPLSGMALFVRSSDDPLDEPGRQHSNLIHDLAVRFRHSIRHLLAMTLGINLLALAIPLFIMAVYDVIIPARSPDQLSYILAGVVIAILFEMSFRVLRAKTFAHVAARTGNIIGNIAFHRLLFLPASRTENAPVGSQLARLKEFDSMRELFSSPIAESLLDIPFVLLFVGIIALLGGPIVFVPLAAAGLFFVATAAISPRLSHVTDRSIRARSAVERFLVEAVSHLRAIRYTGAGERWMERYREASATLALEELKAAKLNHLVLTISQTLVLGAGVATLGIGALRVMAETMSVGALVAVMILVWRVLSPMQAAFVALNQIEQIRGAFRQLTALMRLPLEETGRSVRHRMLDGDIRFSWVSHRYAADDDPVLFGVSFDIAKGEVAAITGPNGSGKSTLVKLLTGLYRPQAGSIMIDGIDIRQLDSVRLRQSIGVVSQPTHLFYGTVAQNLRLSKPTASQDDLVEASKAAKVHDDIMRLPERYETRLTEEVLSMMPAGFRQKLALARVFLRAAPIMIFDEATQGIDEDGDNAFVAAIQRLRGSATIIIVTHRPSHMKLADKLIVMRSGKVAAIGPPDKLLAQNAGSPA